MASKVSTETVTPQKSIGDNLNYSFNYVYDDSYAHRLISAGDRYYKYDANGNIICEQDGSFESNGEEVSYHKITQDADGVYSTDYGWGLFKEDDKGGSGKAGSNKYKRVYKWNERNQLVSSVDDNYSTAYIYGQDGQRSNKYTQNSVKSGSYENAISITGNNVKESDAVLCHPNVKTALGETEEYGSGSAKGRPLSLGCQISHLEDFNEVTNILKDVGFEYGVGKDAWAKGDTIKINIAAPKED